MVDYKLIADSDTGGDLQTAFNTMTAQTVTGTGVYKVNDIMIAAEIGLTKANAFLDAVELAVPPRVLNWLTGEGIDINHADTVTTLTSIAAPNTADVLAMAQVKKFPSLKIGQLQNAREMRARGEV